jgi:hypothetical protein
VGYWQPSVRDYDRRAGLAFRARDLSTAAATIERARRAHPGQHALWDARRARIHDAMDRREAQAVLFGRAAAP